MGVSVGVEPSWDYKSLSLGSFKVMGMNNLKFTGLAIKQQQQTTTKSQTNKQTNRDLLCCEVTAFSFFLCSVKRMGKQGRSERQKGERRDGKETGKIPLSFSHRLTHIREKNKLDHPVGASNR